MAAVAARAGSWSSAGPPAQGDETGRRVGGGVAVRNSWRLPKWIKGGAGTGRRGGGEGGGVAARWRAARRRGRAGSTCPVRRRSSHVDEALWSHHIAAVRCNPTGNGNSTKVTFFFLGSPPKSPGW